MAKVFKISHEAASPAYEEIRYYEAIATANDFLIEWVPIAPGDNGLSQLSSGESEGVLLTGREDYQLLKDKGLQTIISSRGDRRLVAIFASSFELQKTKTEGSTNNIGPEKAKDFGAYPPAESVAVSLRLAVDFDWQFRLIANFLVKALPRIQAGYRFQSSDPESNFDQRLQALLEGKLDVAIFPLAELNASAGKVSGLKYMILPLFECPPNIYQGVTGMVMKDNDSHLSAILLKLVETPLSDCVKREAAVLDMNRGYSFGVFRMQDFPAPFTYFARPADSSLLESWDMDSDLADDKLIFSTTDFMKDFFRYRYLPDEEESDQMPTDEVLFIASHKALHQEALITHASNSRVWVAGTRTWFELAKKGIWVEGGADGLGLETLLECWGEKFINISKEVVNIITNIDSAAHWRQDGWKASGTYQLVPSLTDAITEGLKQAEIVFWTSFQQYQACKSYLKPGVIHASPAGKTATLLRNEGINNLVVFPSIKAFNWWRSRTLTEL